MTDAEKKLELWFFRDLTDVQRMKLFALTHQPMIGPKTDATMHAQKRLLGDVIKQLRGTT